MVRKRKKNNIEYPPPSTVWMSLSVLVDMVAGYELAVERGLASRDPKSVKVINDFLKLMSKRGANNKDGEYWLRRHHLDLVCEVYKKYFSGEITYERGAELLAGLFFYRKSAGVLRLLFPSKKDLNEEDHRRWLKKKLTMKIGRDGREGTTLSPLEAACEHLSLVLDVSPQTLMNERRARIQNERPINPFSYFHDVVTEDFEEYQRFALKRVLVNIIGFSDMVAERVIGQLSDEIDKIILKFR